MGVSLSVSSLGNSEILEAVPKSLIADQWKPLRKTVADILA